MVVISRIVNTTKGRVEEWDKLKISRERKMLIQNLNTQRNEFSSEAEVATRNSDTSVYITDLLGELQTIARIGGLVSLSDDIELVLVKHMSGQSIL